MKKRKRRISAKEKARKAFEAVPPGERIGDAPIEESVHGKMEFLARQIDHFFNGDLRGEDRLTGFVMLVFPFNDHEGRANYISNANRADVVLMLKEQIARFEGQPEQTGQA